MTRASKSADAPRACPCASGEPYARCCEPAHTRAREAPTPTALMRSRYSAFALGLAEYLYDTLDEAHPDRSVPREQALRSLRATAAELRYPGVTILASEEPDADGLARVLFFARVFRKGNDRSFFERSSFLHDGAGWRYLDGELLERAALPAGRAPEALSLDEFRALYAAAQGRRGR